MNALIAKAIAQQVRFEWEQRMDPTGGTEKMQDAHIDHVAEYILAHMDIDYTSKLIKEMDTIIRERFNQACDEYDKWLESLGPEMD